MWNWPDIFKIWSDNVRWPTVISSSEFCIFSSKELKNLLCWAFPFFLQKRKLSMRWLIEAFHFSDGKSLTWLQPLPIQTVQPVSPVNHFSSRQLYEGTINATLIWHFRLNQLNFYALFISLNGIALTGGVSSGLNILAGLENQFGIDWTPNQNLVKLFIFNVTADKNGTFSCSVDAVDVTGFAIFQFRSNVQVHVVGK